MTQKFGRNYRLTIYPPGGGDPILITMPFTINFEMRKSFSVDQNPLQIEVYNLSEKHRNAIYQDWWNYPTTPNNAIDPTTGESLDGNNIILEVGYGNLYRVFVGLISRASSARKGTNIVTKIEAFGNNIDIATTRTFQTLQAGQTLGQLLQTLIGEFPNLQQGNTLDYPLQFNRPVVLNGLTWNLLKQYSNANVYIDNGKVYILRDNETLNTTTVINDSTGILETPRKEAGNLYVTTLFEPGINVGEQVKIESTTQQSYNQLYQVNGITHRGTISGAICGDLVTILELLAPNPINGFIPVSQI